MPTITFLSGSKPFRKHFAKDSVTSYPLIKTVSSETYVFSANAQGLRDKTDLLKDAAARGACLLKGPLKKQLERESRAGQSDRNAATSSVILDIDGLTIPGLEITAPLDRAKITQIAERVVTELPPEFQNVSYIVHASASLGIKANQIRLHLDFTTRDPIPPSSLKNYLAWININSKLFMASTKLTATGKGLILPVDKCLADNSRLIFIGHPSFDGVEDPIPDKDDRIFLVEKEQDCIDITGIVDGLDIGKINTAVKKRIFDLRTAEGRPDVKERTQRVKINGVQVDLVVNPDQMQMQFFQDHGSYVTYNINGGDSHGYYVKKSTPNVVWNFKDESPFMFQQACPETYEWHLEQFCKDISPEAVREAFVFRDIESNTYYNGFYDPVNRRIEFLRPADRGSIGSFMAENGGIPPEHPAQWRLTFDPNNPIELNKKDGVVNLWQEPVLLSELQDCPSLQYGDARTLIAEACPIIDQTIWSVVGNDIECYEHFINWLAFILQYRRKTNTAWLFQGVEGTGKGVLASRIIKPLLENKEQTKSYYHAMRMENIKEQFNDWMEHTLIAFVDEFKAQPNTEGEVLFDKIKNYITEEFSPIRKMRKGQELARNWCNFIFTTNSIDPIRPSETDRRMNIAPRQAMPVAKALQGYREAVLKGEVERELPFFASLMMRFSVDEEKAMTALENEAKNLMREGAADTTGVFIEALRRGDLEHFTEILATHTFGQLEDYRLAAANYVRVWIKEALAGKESVIACRELKPAYNVLVAKQDSDDKFAKMFARRGFHTERMRKNGLMIRGFRVKWTTPPDELLRIAEVYLPEGAPHAPAILTD